MRYYLKPIIDYIRLAHFRTKWRKNNRDNETLPFNVFPIEKVSVGKGTYGNLMVYSYRNPHEFLSIGSYCSIASDVIFVLSGEHRYDTLSTYPFSEKIYMKRGSCAECKGPIEIGDDVWIGVRVTILSGVKIGQGSIIAANSIVMKDVPPYSIYVGNKVLKSRFDSKISKELESILFDNIDLTQFEKYADVPVSKENIDSISKCFTETLK